MLRKRVLIITYYWPPSGGIGVHRCLKFAKYLRDFGWEPVVFTAKDAQYPVFDESNFKHVPENLEVPLVYRGGPVPVQFDSSSLAADGEQVCFALVPCGKK